MDRTSILVLVVCFAVLLLWKPLVVDKLYPPHPIAGTSTNLPTSTNPPPSLSAPPQALGTNTSAFIPLTNAIAEIGSTLEVPEDFLVVSNDNARYTFTSRGGGIKLVELLNYKDRVFSKRQKKQDNQTLGVASLNTYTPSPTFGLLKSDGTPDQGQYHLTQSGNTIRAERDSTNGLKIVKEFTLETNYLVDVKLHLENHSPQPIQVPAQSWVAGTATPLSSTDNGQQVGVNWYNGVKNESVDASWFANRSFGCVGPSNPREEYRGGTSNVVWVAVHNQYFTLAAMPEVPAQEIVARKVELPHFTNEVSNLAITNGPAPAGYTVALAYPSFTLQPNQAVARQVYIYAGPKHYQTLMHLSERFHNNVDSLMDFGWFGFVSKALLLGMNWMHYSLRLSYGLAIILITVIIKLCYWPLTQASTRSMKRMQALQPQLNAIREKHKDDPLKANQKSMEFMRQNKVSPFGGCLPSFLQIPVFFGFYRMLQNAIELRGQPFLWAGDLTRADTVAIIPGLGSIPMIGIAGVGLPINIFPLIMGVTMLWQARLAPPATGVDPAQAKMMRYMPLMFMVFLYNFSAGLTLYWTIQNLFTIMQTKLTPVKVEGAAIPIKAEVLTPGPKKRK